MKKIISVAIVLLLVTISCQKNKGVDIAALFKNKIWTGQFNYLNMGPEYYSLQCKEDGSFTWYQYGLSHTGTLKLEEKLLTLTFNNGNIIKAEVSDDKILVNIQNDAANGWSLSSGEYNTATEQALDGTTWKEKNNQGILSFSSGAKVSGTGIFAGTQDNSYSRIAGTISFPPGFGDYFLVLMADGNTIRLLNKSFLNYHPYILTKQ